MHDIIIILYYIIYCTTILDYNIDARSSGLDVYLRTRYACAERFPSITKFLIITIVHVLYCTLGLHCVLKTSVGLRVAAKRLPNSSSWERDRPWTVQEDRRFYSKRLLLRTVTSVATEQRVSWLAN